MPSGGGPAVPTSAGFNPFTAPPPPLNWVVWDLETTGLEDHPQILVGVLWSSKTNWPYIYFRHQVEQLAAALEQADVVVSYNGKGYDAAVLQENVGRRVRFARQIDLLEEIQSHRPAFEKGWKLDDVAARLWGTPKVTESAKIPEIWKAGETHAVISHALLDVYYTRTLFEHIRDRGFVIAPDNSNTEIKCPDWWRQRMVNSPDNAPNVAVKKL